jgi:sulfite dehydrogenase (quinone) subunit SoeC
MKPALSVIFFTVASGFGLGLTIWLIIAEWCRNCAAGISKETFFVGAIFAFGFVTAGLISSTLHLANPKNAWRAFGRFRTSWLSREGVFSIVFFVLAAVHAFAVWSDVSAAARMVSGALLILCALAILYCTGMIYACLKTIPQWRSWTTPAGYVLYGLLSGLLGFCAIAARGDTQMSPWLRLALVLLVLGFFLWTIKQSRNPATQNLQLGDALGIREGRVRLLDSGHTHGTFLTNEFGFRIARERAALLTTWSLVLAFIAPLFIVVIESSLSAKGMLGLAALLCFIGLLIERWMFFANARHVVMRYHGE